MDADLMVDANAKRMRLSARKSPSIANGCQVSSSGPQVRLARVSPRQRHAHQRYAPERNRCPCPSLTLPLLCVSTGCLASRGQAAVRSLHPKRSALAGSGNHRTTKDGSHTIMFPATTETINKPRTETIEQCWMMPQLETINKRSGSF